MPVNVFSSPDFQPLTEKQLRATPVAFQEAGVSGEWAYYAGISGTVFINSGSRVLQITATAGSVAATISIRGGDNITIPAGKSLTIEPRGNLTEADIVFTNTEAYFVEQVS